MTESHLHNCPINLLIIDLHHFCWKPSTRPLFHIHSQKLCSSLFLPYHPPCLISLPFVFIHTSLIFFSLSLPLLCLPSVPSWFPSVLPISLPTYLRAANKSIVRARKPRRNRFKGTGRQTSQDPSCARTESVTSFSKSSKAQGWPSSSQSFLGHFSTTLSSITILAFSFNNPFCISHACTDAREHTHTKLVPWLLVWLLNPVSMFLCTLTRCVWV